MKLKKIDLTSVWLVLLSMVIACACSSAGSQTVGTQPLPLDREQAFMQRDRLIERVETLQSQAEDENLDPGQREAIEREIEFIQEREIPALTALLKREENSEGSAGGDRRIANELAGDYFRYLIDSADYRQSLLQLRTKAATQQQPELSEQERDQLFAETLTRIAADSESIILLTEVGLYSRAVNLYETLAETVPQSLIGQPVLLAASRSYLGIGRVVLAAALYRRLTDLQIGDGRVELALLIGERYLARQDSGQALEYFGLSAQLADNAAGGGSLARKRIEYASSAGGYGSSDEVYNLAQARINIALEINFSRTREICKRVIGQGGRNNLVYEAKSLREQTDQAELRYVNRLMAGARDHESKRAESATEALAAYLSDEPQSKYRKKIERVIGETASDDVPAGQLLDEAQRFSAAGQYRAAIARYRRARQAPGSSAVIADEKLREAIDVYVGLRRQKAAELFLQARRIADEKRKARLLLSIESILADLIENYSETKLLDKIKVNREAVEDALKQIDPQLIEELRAQSKAEEER
jgi:hypothetical protein